MNKWIERIAIVLFCLLIALPFGMTLLGIQSAIAALNHIPAGFSVSINQFLCHMLCIPIS